MIKEFGIEAFLHRIKKLDNAQKTKSYSHDWTGSVPAPVREAFEKYLEYELVTVSFGYWHISL
ncbi:hypothetical protein CSB45_06205 [candidate division KSB3 bacterium]|uniref:Uncharacterized protein n=1 Tax=candidate division KSB3 bacterium TaxID=2044937 RepID=A0A2G6E7S0_9BACT|nr:MAG: hypothetical protein CSB45_06205 [candidate division KSB3 bacterium]PIE30237.1 MAG: hypothetical protein CSA57_04920 [candidate division KSB3 bacterium]